MSIGEVLSLLQVEFPDTTISKLRFLESEGLVEPRRTTSGYRKYAAADVTRLRQVLTAQRDHYLPLRVIRDQLAAVERGDEVRSRVSLVALADSGTPTAPPAQLFLTRAELIERAGLSEETLATLEQYGLVAARSGGGYDADALEVATAAGRLAEFGLEARHLRAYRAAADREVGLFSQLVAPLTRQPGPAARARAAETFLELAACTQRLHSALVRAGLRQTLGR
jgi:DNA-binding transcriptional MerR regulator